MNATKAGLRIGIVAAVLALALLASPAAQACSGYCDYSGGCATCKVSTGWTGMACDQWAPCACSELLCIASFETPESSSAPDPAFAPEAAPMTSAAPAAGLVGCSDAAPSSSF